MKKVLHLCFCFHLFLVLGMNVSSVVITTFELYEGNPRQGEKLEEEPAYIQFFRAAQEILSVTNFYQEFTGTNTGYGFYAPQISSSITPMFDVFVGDRQVAAFEQISYPQKELKLRVESLFDQHLEKIDELLRGGDLNRLNEQLYYRFLDLRMHSLSRCLFRQYPEADRVKAKLYLFEFPALFECTLLNIPYSTHFHKTYEYEYQIKT